MYNYFCICVQLYLYYLIFNYHHLDTDCLTVKLLLKFNNYMHPTLLYFAPSSVLFCELKRLYVKLNFEILKDVNNKKNVRYSFFFVFVSSNMK